VGFLGGAGAADGAAAGCAGFAGAVAVAVAVGAVLADAVLADEGAVLMLVAASPDVRCAAYRSRMGHHDCATELLSFWKSWYCSSTSHSFAPKSLSSDGLDTVSIASSEFSGHAAGSPRRHRLPA
jgi:hypothetical protein